MMCTFSRTEQPAETYKSRGLVANIERASLSRRVSLKSVYRILNIDKHSKKHLSNLPAPICSCHQLIWATLKWESTYSLSEERAQCVCVLDVVAACDGDELNIITTQKQGLGSHASTKEMCVCVLSDRSERQMPKIQITYFWSDLVLIHQTTHTVGEGTYRFKQSEDSAVVCSTQIIVSATLSLEIWVRGNQRSWWFLLLIKPVEGSLKPQGLSEVAIMSFITISLGFGRLWLTLQQQVKVRQKVEGMRGARSEIR